MSTLGACTSTIVKWDVRYQMQHANGRRMTKRYGASRDPPSLRPCAHCIRSHNIDHFQLGHDRNSKVCLKNVHKQTRTPNRMNTNQTRVRTRTRAARKRRISQCLIHAMRRFRCINWARLRFKTTSTIESCN